MVITGLLAVHRHLPLVIGVWGVFGVLVMLVASLAWPRQSAMAAEIARVGAANARAEAAEAATGTGTRTLDEATTVELSVRGMRTVEIPAGMPPLHPRRAAADEPGGGRHRLWSSSS